MLNLDLEQLLYMLPAILIGFTIHEFSHAFVAVKLGDDTPKVMGRLTLNPVVHIDPIGFLLIIVAGFGWAKAVQFNPLNFKNPKNDTMLVALAGPISNLLLAILSAIILKILDSTAGYNPSQIMIGLGNMFSWMLWINAMLAVFNLFPIPPLDGSHVLLNLIPDQYINFKLAYLQFGRFALLGLILLGRFAGTSLLPIAYFTEKIVSGLMNIFGIG